MRPLGAAFFGHLGDTRGRPQTLILSIILMAVPTCLMGFLPTYSQAGLWAPIMLTLLRCGQGFSVGGEFTGSITYMAEKAPAKRRGLFTSFASFGTVTGMLIGSMTGVSITRSLSEAALLSWGWRLAFWCGIFLGVSIFFVRRSLLVKPLADTCDRKVAVFTSPVRETFSHHFPLLMRIIGFTSFIGVSFYMVTVYVSAFLTTEAHLPLPISLEINTIAMGVMIILIPPMGALSDHWGRKPLMLTLGIKETRDKTLEV